MSGLYGVCVETAKVTDVHLLAGYGFARIRDTEEVIHFYLSAHSMVVPGRRHVPVFSWFATPEVEGQEILIPEIAVDDRIVFVRSQDHVEGRPDTALVWCHKLLWNIASEDMNRRPIYVCLQERRFDNPMHRKALGDEITTAFIGYWEDINHLPDMWETENGLGPTWSSEEGIMPYAFTRLWFVLDPQDPEALIQLDQDPRLSHYFDVEDSYRDSAA